MKHFWQKTAFALLLCATLSPSAAQAQEVLPEHAVPLIVTPHSQTLSSAARLFHVGVTANVPYECSTEADWLTIKQSVNGVYVHVGDNYLPSSREADVVFSNADKGVSSTIHVVQRGFEPETAYREATNILPSSAKVNQSQNGYGIDKSYDGDYSSIYHSNYYTIVSETNPVVLTYNFTDVDRIDYVSYVPRLDGGKNGCFQQFQVYVKCKGDTDYQLYNSYDWDGSPSVRNISFGEGGLKNPVSIQFKVTKGYSDNATYTSFVSCAEMEFCKKKDGAENPYDIFADDMYTKLKDGFTVEDLEKVEDPIAKSLAWQMLNGGYSTDYRVASYPCYNSPQYFSDIWNAPGKYYDQIAGVTGINMEKGKHAVLVKGIPDSMSVQLKVVAWYIGREENDLGSGVNPVTTTFLLRNGMNIINYTYDWPGLAYIGYYSYGSAAKNPAIKVHFINGDAQGYLSPDKTNEEMYALTGNATNTCMDLVGHRVHSVWTADGLHKYCKASDGSSLGYRQYMNLLDTLVTWEQDLLGFAKYDRLPDLRTMAYVNFTYYMFQGGFGVSFHHDQEKRVLNCKTLMYNDYDAIWGLSHEWGHQHQMTPYFNFAGMTEVTNNMNSYYNTIHMGYTSGFGHTAEPSDGLGIYNESPNYVSQRDHTTYTTVTNNRHEAYKNRGRYGWNSNLAALCESMKDSLYTSVEEDKLHAFSYNNYYNVRPFLALYQYAVSVLGLKDFAQDMYEALRQTDYTNGSSIEKTTGLDKYEALAAAQNGNKNGHYARLVSQFPNSVWVTNRYVPEGASWGANSVPFIMNLVRKTSRLTGYNLFPYFEKLGFLRTVALRFYDGSWYLMTKDMYDEFKQDMEDLGLKECNEQMIKDIMTIAVPKTTRPVIPN